MLKPAAPLPLAIRESYDRPHLSPAELTQHSPIKRHDAAVSCVCVCMSACMRACVLLCASVTVHEGADISTRFIFGPSTIHLPPHRRNPSPPARCYRLNTTSLQRSRDATDTAMLPNRPLPQTLPPSSPPWGKSCQNVPHVDAVGGSAAPTLGL